MLFDVKIITIIIIIIVSIMIYLLFFTNPIISACIPQVLFFYQKSKVTYLFVKLL